MDHTRFGVQLIAPLPIFGGRPRDRLIVCVGEPDPVTLMRTLPPNFGAVAEALEQGLVLPLNPLRRAEDLLALLARLEADGPPPRHWQSAGGAGRALRHLRRLK